MDDCLEDKRERYQNCCALFRVYHGYVHTHSQVLSLLLSVFCVYITTASFFLLILFVLAVFSWLFWFGYRYHALRVIDWEVSSLK